MPLIPNEIIQNILNNIDIVNIISKYVKLQKKGKDYIGLCPFHDDRNPSLSISQSKQIYKCFVCGNGGNVIIFLTNYKKIHFLEAVKELAIIAKIDLSNYNTTIKQRTYSKDEQELIEINQVAANYFHYQLLSHKDDKTDDKTDDNPYSYLINKRKIPLSLIETFQLGFSDHSLIDYLISKKYSKELIIKAGLGTEKNNQLKAFFLNRIIFPFFNDDNKIIAFSGRTFEKNDFQTAKYLNSIETILFSKNTYLYNIYNGLKSINQNRNFYLVEGFFDAISLTKLGINNVLAISGTTFTSNHQKYLNRLKIEPIFIFDNDKPGFNATISLAKKEAKENNHLITVNKTLLVAKKEIKDFDELSTNLEENRDIYNKLRLQIEKNNCSFFEYLLLGYQKELITSKNYFKQFEEIKQIYLKIIPFLNFTKGQIQETFYSLANFFANNLYPNQFDNELYRTYLITKNKELIDEYYNNYQINTTNKIDNQTNFEDLEPVEINKQNSTNENEHQLIANNKNIKMTEKLIKEVAFFNQKLTMLYIEFFIIIINFERVFQYLNEGFIFNIFIKFYKDFYHDLLYTIENNPKKDQSSEEYFLSIITKIENNKKDEQIKFCHKIKQIEQFFVKSDNYQSFKKNYLENENIKQVLTDYLISNEKFNNKYLRSQFYYDLANSLEQIENIDSQVNYEATKNIIDNLFKYNEND